MTVGIYGLGRFGSFWAQTIRDNSSDDVRVVATSRRRHEVPCGVEFLNEDEFFTSCDVIYFCVAI